MCFDGINTVLASNKAISCCNQANPTIGLFLIKHLLKGLNQLAITVKVKGLRSHLAIVIAKGRHVHIMIHQAFTNNNATNSQATSYCSSRSCIYNSVSLKTLC